MRVRHVLTVFVSSMLVVGAAWAGIGLAPVPGADPGATLAVGNAVPVSLADAGVGTGEALGADEALVGAAKVSIKPQPDAAEGEVWQREGCAVITNPQSSADHVADFSGGPWAENPNCIYMGGYGIGPTNPVRTWDDEDDGGYGLWSRSVAVSRGGQLVVLTILDAVYYFGEYRTMCPGCGAFDLANDLAEDYAALGATPSSFVFASTHSHTAPDFIGGWGGVPRWYHEQVAEAMKRSVADALASMRPATIVAGETLARAFNSERRDNYRSAEDPTLAWFRALDRDQQTIATVGAYAAHAVSVSAGAGKAHADYPAVFARRAEDRFGGVGMVFQAGLGNMSPRSGPPIAGKPDAPNWERQGYGLADAIPATGGTLVTSPDVRVRSEFWDQPVTNSGLLALGTPGFFDRPFSQLPATVTAGKNRNKPCVSASPVSVKTKVTAAKIGDLVVTGAPGEIFANYSNTIKERSSIAALAIGAADDGLGYIIQAFETDHAGRQVTGFVAPMQAVEYEDAYSIDACFGDKALETTVALLGTL